MNKTAIIFKNELLTTLKRKGFIITTLALPALGILAILIFQLISSFMKPPVQTAVTRVGYVDQVGIFAGYTQYDKLELVQYASPQEANAALVAGQVQEYFVIPDNYVASGMINRYSTKTELEPPSNVVNATRSFLVNNLLKDKVSGETALRVSYPLNLTNTVLDKSGGVSAGQGGFGAYIISYLFSILLIMSIFTASGYLLQGLSEEKENRVMEILLSSVSTRQLITGKVLALGVAGLIQIVVWLASGYALMRTASSSIGGFFTNLSFPPEVIILSLIYFILGYFLYAILMAGVGAIAPTQRDGQQMSVIFTLCGSIPYFLMPFIIENGDHIVTKILTIFPLTAPLTIMMRINSGIPLWEILVSVAVLVLAIWGSLLLASRVFRIYLLMYGKAPGWREVVKSLRQAG
jgi:ABC-2 type transport system permease protein